MIDRFNLTNWISCLGMLTALDVACAEMLLLPLDSFKIGGVSGRDVKIEGRHSSCG